MTDRPARRITVAICTYDRFDVLRHALGGLSRQTLDQGLFDVLIVDNGDDVAARDAFLAECPLPPNARLVVSHPPGLSRARNRALEICETPRIVFLDDDAVPAAGWLEAIVDAFRCQPEAAVVAGPVEPLWPSARPDWMPLEYEACLGLLDHGTTDRWLGPNEYGWGANIAFAVQPLREVGGFSTDIGRIGARTLLSGEEIAVQDALRARGHKAWYAAEARVVHHVAADRLRRNWFRSRMAWQAVSELLETPSRAYPDWTRSEIVRIAKILGLEDALHGLFARAGKERFAEQLAFVRHLVALLLHGKDLQDEELETMFRPAGLSLIEDVAEGVADSREPGDEDDDLYRPSASVGPATEHVFVESLPGHGYMFDLYGNLPGAQLVEMPGNPWNGAAAEGLRYVERSLTGHVRSLVFLTLDPFIYDTGRTEALLSLIQRVRIPCFAVLHRIPAAAEQVRALRRLARALRGVIGLSAAFCNQMRGVLNLPNTIHVPHHPTKFQLYGPGQAITVREALGVRPSQVVFSLLGELREGKGLGLILAAFDHIPVAERQRMFFLFAGKAPEQVAGQVLETLLRKRIPGRVDLRANGDPVRYAVLTNGEYADYISATDVGLLLYQQDQRGCMSGVLSDYVWNRKRVIATADSLVGMEVRQHELGLVVDQEMPEVLARGFIEAASRARADAAVSDAYEAYRDGIAPDAVLDCLAAVLATEKHAPRHHGAHRHPAVRMRLVEGSAAGADA